MTPAAGRVLVVGWFSVDDGEITAGDVLARETVRGWLAGASVAHDVASTPEFAGAGDVDWRAVDPADYSAVLWVCGPVSGPVPARVFGGFPGVRRLAVGVSATDGMPSLDGVLPRDGNGAVRPDLSLGAPLADTPTAAVVLAHPQPEYGDRGRHRAAAELIGEVVRRRGLAGLPIDTRLDVKAAGAPRGSGDVVAWLRRADVVLTSRLHGLVLALRAGVPALAVDPIAGGGKVLAQARALQWPAVVSADADDVDAALRWVEWCLTDAARSSAGDCVVRAAGDLDATRRQLLSVL